MCQRPEREVQLRYALCASSLNRATRSQQGEPRPQDGDQRASGLSKGALGAPLPQPSCLQGASAQSRLICTTRPGNGKAPTRRICLLAHVSCVLSTLDLVRAQHTVANSPMQVPARVASLVPQTHPARQCRAAHLVKYRRRVLQGVGRRRRCVHLLQVCCSSKPPSQRGPEPGGRCAHERSERHRLCCCGIYLCRAAIIIRSLV